MRGIFAACWASADKQRAESMAQRARTVIFFLMSFSLSRSTRHSTTTLAPSHLSTTSFHPSLVSLLNPKSPNPLPLTPHCITLSARASTFCGMVTPICFAVLRLITSSNSVGCCTGKSAGLAPFRILSTYPATRRLLSAWSAP